MQNQETFGATRDDAAPTPTLADVIGPVWAARWLVLLITAVIAIAAVSVNHLAAAYVSQGFLQFGGAIPLPKEKSIREQAKDKEKRREQAADRNGNKEDLSDRAPSPGISLANFKRYASAYLTREQFAEFVREKKLEAAPGVGDLQAIFASRDGIGKMIEPVYLFTKLDAKELMEQPRDGVNNVLGLRITFASKTPQLAQQTVDLLGKYVMDSIVYSIYSDEIRAQLDDAREKIAKLDNEIIAVRVTLQEHQEKIATLKQLLARNPDHGKENTRQVVEVSDATAHFLPLSAQLTTTEVLAANDIQSINRVKREQEQKIILLQYYQRAKAALDRSKSGETVLRSLAGVKDEVFKGKNIQDDTVKEVFNSITSHNQSALDLYFDRTRFVAGPTLPQYSTARPSIALGVGLLIGFLTALLVVFVRRRLHAPGTVAS